MFVLVSWHRAVLPLWSQACLDLLDWTLTPKLTSFLLLETESWSLNLQLMAETWFPTRWPEIRPRYHPAMVWRALKTSQPSVAYHSGPSLHVGFQGRLSSLCPYTAPPWREREYTQHPPLRGEVANQMLWHALGCLWPGSGPIAHGCAHVHSLPAQAECTPFPLWSTMRKAMFPKTDSGHNLSQERQSSHPPFFSLFPLPGSKYTWSEPSGRKPSCPSHFLHNNSQPCSWLLLFHTLNHPDSERRKVEWGPSPALSQSMPPHQQRYHKSPISSAIRCLSNCLQNWSFGLCWAIIICIYRFLYREHKREGEICRDM